MKTLAHYIPEKDYIAILNSLIGLDNITVANVHQQLFDFVHINKIDNVILPIHEYSQEFHYFVKQNAKTKNIIVYFGHAHHDDLAKYCAENNICIIKRSETLLDSPYVIYDRLYDNTVFKPIETTRNNKILVVLSQDNVKNQNFLDGHLYPDNESSVCLINNPTYEHPQNIGAAYQTDLAILMNAFDSLVDLDGAFTLEAQACKIKNLKLADNLTATLEHNNMVDEIPNIEQYASDAFVTNKLLPLMKGL